MCPAAFQLVITLQMVLVNAQGRFLWTYYKFLLQDAKQGERSFLCTAQYKIIKHDSHTHTIQTKTKLNIYDVPKYQDMQR